MESIGSNARQKQISRTVTMGTAEEQQVSATGDLHMQDQGWWTHEV